jgi:hypothetical protein
MTTLIFRIRRTSITPVATYSVCELWAGGVCVYRGYGIEHSPDRMAIGTYKATYTRSNRFSAAAGHDIYTWELQGVYDGDRLRQGIRIHSANLAKDLLGCIALGMQHADINHDGVMDVTSSRTAIKLFEQACGSATEISVVVVDPS